MNRFTKDTFRLLALCLGALCLHGCLELIRRPAEGGPIPYTPSVATIDTSRTRPPSSVPVAKDRPNIATLPPLAVINRPERSRKQWQSIEKINEYAIWCIENEMWNEARSHLERAITQDSLSASLHNNLGIVYERLGMVDKATGLYRRAQALNPSKKAYTANLSYLQQRQQAAHDSTGEFDIFRLEHDNRPDARRTGERPPYTGE